MGGKSSAPSMAPIAQAMTASAQIMAQATEQASALQFQETGMGITANQTQLAQAQGNLYQFYALSQGQQAPYRLAGYNALDSYEDTLGVARPAQGSAVAADQLQGFMNPPTGNTTQGDKTPAGELAFNQANFMSLLNMPGSSQTTSTQANPNPLSVQKSTSGVDPNLLNRLYLPNGGQSQIQALMNQYSAFNAAGGVNGSGGGGINIKIPGSNSTAGTPGMPVLATQQSLQSQLSSLISQYGMTTTTEQYLPMVGYVPTTGTEAVPGAPIQTTNSQAK